MSKPKIDGDVIIAVGLFAIAVGLRIAFVLGAYDSAFFDLNTQRGTDMWTYVSWARGIAGGDLIGDTVFRQAPLYPYVLGFLLWFSGGSLLTACLFQAVMGAASCVLIYAAARRIFSRPWAALAGAVLCFYEGAIFFTSFALATTLAVLCSSAILLLATLAWSRKSHILWGALGLAVGIASTGRPNFLLLCVAITAAAIAISLWGERLFEQWPRGKQLWTLIGCFLLFFCLAVLPVTTRNAAVSGRFVPVSANAMVTYRLANSYDSLVYNHMISVKKELMPIWSGAFWLHQTRKAAGFWIGYEIPQNADMYLCRRYSTVLRLPLLPFIIIGPLGIAGLCLGIRRFRDFCPAYILVLTWYVSIIPFYVVSRLRLPIVPPLILFSVLTVKTLVDLCRIRRWVSVAGIVVLVGILALGSYALRTGDSATRVIRVMRVAALNNLSRAMMGRQNNASAIELMRESIRIRQKQPSVHLDLGRLLAAEGNTDEAVYHLKAALQSDPRYFQSGKDKQPD